MVLCVGLKFTGTATSTSVTTGTTSHMLVWTMRFRKYALGSVGVMVDWSERIPAAIEKAEGHIDAWVAGIEDLPLTKGEVPLAKALWEVWVWAKEHGRTHAIVPLALRDFVLKVEAL
jgi:hypothetical protein